MNNKWKKHYMNIKNTRKYFPEFLDINLLLCTKECSHVYLGTSKFKHICDHCNTEFKTMYNFKYKLAKKTILKRKDIYKDMPILNGNTDESLDFIDDITYEDLINGKVDCIGDINEIPIALAVCSKKCKHVQLIYDGASQICPKCGKQLFRIKVKNYKLIK
jgi:hypothetical protein